MRRRCRFIVDTDLDPSLSGMAAKRKAQELLGGDDDASVASSTDSKKTKGSKRQAGRLGPMTFIVWGVRCIVSAMGVKWANYF